MSYENVLTRSLLLRHSLIEYFIEVFFLNCVHLSRHSLVENNDWFLFLIRIEALVFKVYCLFELRNGLVEVFTADAFGVDGLFLLCGFKVRVASLFPRLLRRGALLLLLG